MFSNRLLMVISTRSPSPFCIDGNRAHSTGRPRAPQRRNGPRARPVPERMSRRLMQFVAALLLTAPALPLIAAPSPLTASMHEVERIRGLKFDHDIRHVDIGRDELRCRLRAQMPKTMDAMGLDPEAMRDMVVIHELTHALQDQHFAAGAREKALTKDTDGGLAFHSLLEGEATLVMMDYMLDKMGQPLDALVKNPQVLEAMAGATDKTIDANVPRYFVESLKFPYLEGLKLCIEGYRRGGWKMIDKMDANPPQSTREVLHPADYFARLERGGSAKAFDDAALVAAPGTISVEHLGEFHWRYLVGATASAGWVDDRVQIAQNKDHEPTVLAETRWNSDESARRFRDAYVAFLHERGVTARATVAGGTVRVGYGADAALIAKFVGS